MTTADKIQTLFYILSILGMAFLIYRNWRGPQEKTEKDDLEMRLQIRQLQADLINLRDNHVHTLDTKLDETNKSVSALAIEQARLNTIIEERIPKRK